ncbi:hybrid sensor histidine kinase/response regulator [Desulfonatronovibrio hydrogenovorans]|uniref:hybrid sensor histidine kinase/response regulator n=1 Tax=Desulfonatronovibrio hydrogenovorans TaxID=53245 RepID=UPI00068EC44E|nr:response regulator [Desulfonatronovibrio hydrogenovorans]
MDEKDKIISRLEQEIQYLREERRKGVDALEMAANLGRFDKNPGSSMDADYILKETAVRLNTLIKLKAVSFYLVSSQDNSFYQAYCNPAEDSSVLNQEIDRLIEDHTFAWVLNRSRPVILSCTGQSGSLILGSMASPSRIRGMFVGILDQDKMQISDTSFYLISIVLLSSASALGRIEAYDRMREMNQELEKYARHTERLYQNVFENSPVGIFWTSPEGKFLKVNPACAEIAGFDSSDQMLKESLDIGDQLYLNRQDRESHLEQLNSQGLVQNREVRLRRRSGRPFWALLNMREVREHQGGPVVYHDGFLVDITDKKKAEKDREELQRQLLHSQKMESVGTLAGGVAHDFNNLLQAMSGNVQLLLGEKDENHADVHRLVKISSSIDRASQMIRQLLVFSRKAEAQRVFVDLNQEIESAVMILERTIPKMVEIELHLDKELWPVNADPVQIEQVLLNLGINAGHAMPDGGKLLIETRNIILDSDFVKKYMKTEVGEYVLLTVTDTGLGMDKEIMKHIFDPFYTTKETGKGTGLGLASVYGSVKAHNGHISCYSEPGQGSIFKIYWPAVSGAILDVADSKEDISLQKGDESVLVVDDEEDIRELTKEALQMMGYSVFTASSGEEALKIYSQKFEDIHLIILDLNMPGMGGHKCLEEILKVNSNAKVLISSGYSSKGQAKEALQSGAAGFIGKPYQISDLVLKVRNVLDTQ